jgi:hypothetical protein
MNSGHRIRPFLSPLQFYPIVSRHVRMASKEAKNPQAYPLTQSIILEGHFTDRNSSQYVVYLRFGEYPEENWCTEILDSNLNVISILGENDYAHIKPFAVGDINSDGLDEIWTQFEGSEGVDYGVFYWRGGAGRMAFRAIATSYNGL